MYYKPGLGLPTPVYAKKAKAPQVTVELTPEEYVKRAWDRLKSGALTQGAEYIASTPEGKAAIEKEVIRRYGPIALGALALVFFLRR